MVTKSTKSKQSSYQRTKRYKQWHVNQALIQTAYAELIKELKRCPTVLEVSKEVNLSVKAIDNHIKEMDFNKMIDPMRSLTPDVIMAIYESALKGKSASQKLWVQIIEKWVETQEVQGTVKITVNAPDKKK